MSEININDLRQIHAAATQSTWEVDAYGLFITEAEHKQQGAKIVQSRGHGYRTAILGLSVDEAYDRELNDLVFIALAHQIWPDLLDELEQLRDRTRKVQVFMDQCADCCGCEASLTFVGKVDPDSFDGSERYRLTDWVPKFCPECGRELIWD
jgi:hypothetical protein